MGFPCKIVSKQIWLMIVKNIVTVTWRFLDKQKQADRAGDLLMDLKWQNEKVWTYNQENSKLGCFVVYWWYFIGINSTGRWRRGGETTRTFCSVLFQNGTSRDSKCFTSHSDTDLYKTFTTWQANHIWLQRTAAPLDIGSRTSKNSNRQCRRKMISWKL